MNATQLTETLIYDGNRTERSAIWFEITRVITKLHDRVAGDQFVNHECDFKPKLPDTKFYYQLIISILKSFLIKREFKVAQNSFQHLYWMGRYNHSLSRDATTMVSKNLSIIGKHVAIIFLTE